MGLLTTAAITAFAWAAKGGGVAALTKFPSVYSQPISKYLENNGIPSSILEGVHHQNTRVTHRRSPLAALGNSIHDYSSDMKRINSDDTRDLIVKFRDIGVRTALTTAYAVRDVATHALEISDNYIQVRRPLSEKSASLLTINPDCPDAVGISPFFAPDEKTQNLLRIYAVSFAAKLSDFPASPEDDASDIKSLERQVAAEIHALKVTQEMALNAGTDLSSLIRSLRAVQSLENFDIPQADKNYATSLAIDAWEQGQDIPSAEQILTAHNLVKTAILKDLPAGDERNRETLNSTIELMDAQQFGNRLAARLLEISQEARIILTPENTAHKPDLPPPPSNDR